MKITIKGQVTIPQNLREEFGLLPYSEVIFESRKEGVLIRPSLSKKILLEKNIRAARGIATEKITTDQIMKLTR